MLPFCVCGLKIHRPTDRPTQALKHKRNYERLEKERERRGPLLWTFSRPLILGFEWDVEGVYASGDNDANKHVLKQYDKKKEEEENKRKTDNAKQHHCGNDAE